MDLKSVPQGALSLGLLQGRPKKLRSLWGYWKHNLHQHSQQGPGICTAQAGLSHPCASGIYNQQCRTRSPKKRAMKQRTKAPGNTDISGVGGDSIAPKVSKPERTRKKTSTKSPEGRLGTEWVSRRDVQPTWKMQPVENERRPLIWQNGSRW